MQTVKPPFLLNSGLSVVYNYNFLNEHLLEPRVFLKFLKITRRRLFISVQRKPECFPRFCFSV